MCYLGPDVPIEDFGVIQRGRGASLVCISLTPPAAAGDVARAVRILESSTTRAPLRPGARRTIEAGSPELLAGAFTPGHVRGCEAFGQALERGSCRQAVAR